MKTRTLLSVMILVLLTAAIQAQDRPNDNPFLRTTAQTDESLNVTFADHANFKPDNRLTDPGPVWQGLTDTTAFNERMNAHIYRADLKVERLKKQLKGQRLIEPIENKAMQYLSAERELKNARLLARAALNAHPEKSFRDFAQRWESKISEKVGQLNTDPEVYFYLAEIDSSELSPELRYILDQKLTEFERNGVLLGKEEREQVARLKSKIATFGNQFERNIFTADTTITLHVDSLAGLPSNWIEEQTPDEQGRVTIPINNPTMNLIMFNADNQDTRRIAARAFFERSYPQNLATLDSLRITRHNLAQLLGYKSWAQYALEPTMAGSPDQVHEFLSKIDRITKKSVQSEIDQLLKIKKQLTPQAQEVEWIDWFYLQNKLREQNHSFSSAEMRTYLPYARVRDGLFAITERLFGLDIQAAPDVPVWNPAVETYEVFESKQLIGRIYFDMFPRKGKFGHAGEFPLRMSNHTVPETVLLVNLSGTPDDPGLLSPGQLTTFFHEFGHALHSIFQGNNAVTGPVEQDFIEAPSQLFEEWARDPEIIRSFARHQETGEAIPQKMVDGYNQSNQFGRALYAHYRLWRAVLSLEHFNSDPKQQSTEAIEDLVFDQYFEFDSPDWFMISSALPHLYPMSSNYYTYLWSDVIGRNLLTRFSKDNLMNQKTAQRYRTVVLESSGTAPMEELIEEFLGRPFNTDAWQAWLNGGNDQTLTPTGR